MSNFVTNNYGMSFFKIVRGNPLGENPINRIKKAPEGADLLNGASYGTELEDNCVFVAHQTLHETELMLNIKKWIRA